jgi:hypothetical protein
MTWRTWRRHFETNATRPIPSIGAPELQAEQRSALARSLARFQLGESGEGRIAHEIDRATLPGVDDDYRHALKLFVKEEGRHARILGLMVNEVGGQVLARQWTERLFVHGRRLLGLRFKLLVLLAAEVVGITFYGALARALGPSPLRDTLLQICGDEEHHLAFHRDFFRAQAEAGGLGSRLLWCAWWPLAWTAGLMVLLDHRATLSALEVPRLQLVKELGSRIVEAGAFNDGEATEVLG